ncbi:uncharacterized protein METZ01_LOCUS399148, partial [marine metagenome]
PQTLWIQLRPVSPWLSGSGLRKVHPDVRQSHLPRPRKRRLVGTWRWFRRRVRWPHHLCRSPTILGLPVSRSRRRRLRGNHRGPERRRLRRAPLGRVGGQSHGSVPWSPGIMRVRQGPRLQTERNGFRFSIRPREPI